MQQSVFIPTRSDLEQIVSNAVSAAIAEAMPGAIRKATRKAWLSGPEVCDLLSISKRSLQHLRTTRQISFSQHGRKISYPTEGIEKYLQANRIKSRLESATPINNIVKPE